MKYRFLAVFITLTIGAAFCGCKHAESNVQETASVSQVREISYGVPNSTDDLDFSGVDIGSVGIGDMDISDLSDEDFAGFASEFDTIYESVYAEHENMSEDELLAELQELVNGADLGGIDPNSLDVEDIYEIIGSMGQ